jgi:hypothetical protein
MALSHPLAKGRVGFESYARIIPLLFTKEQDIQKDKNSLILPKGN